VQISIVIQSWNFADYLHEAIASALALSAPAADEIIVIDDASSDASAQIAKGFDDPRLRVIVNAHNLGAAQTFNRAFAQSCGEFVARLDGDDRYRPDFLTHAMAAFARHPEAVAVYGRIEMIDRAGRASQPERHPALPCGVHCGDRFLDLMADNFLSARTLIARRQAWQRALPLPADMAFFDWYAALRIAESGPLAFTDAVHADYRVHAAGMHNEMIRQGWGETIYFRVLDQLFSEPSRAAEKALRRGQIKAAWYRRLGDSYFGTDQLGAARRCYVRALLAAPRHPGWPTSSRRLLATWLPPAVYVRAKRLARLANVGSAADR